jgi:hypothetical protein
VLSDFGFDVPSGGGWTAQKKYGIVRTIRDESAPLSPPNVLELYYPAGFTGGGYSPGAERSPPLPRGVRELYWGVYWKANADWENHLSNINKILFGWINQQMTFGLTWHWGWQDAAGNRIQRLGFFTGGDYWHYNQPNEILVRPGQWYQIELYFKTATTATSRDGVIRLWVNGVLMADHVGVQTVPGSITETYLDPDWGGVGGAPMRHANWMRLDHVRLSVR